MVGPSLLAGSVAVTSALFLVRGVFGPLDPAVDTGSSQHTNPDSQGAESQRYGDEHHGLHRSGLLVVHGRRQLAGRDADREP